MVATLYHRGPDEAGLHLEPEVGLANARLAIIDLAGGRQPLANEDGTIHLVQNGEVFNFRELRAELQQKGHRFSSRSDTEVLVHLYEEEGLDFARRLNGQFSIALYDRRRRRLVLVRDAAGITPLYYTQTDGRLLFASEVKALAAHPAVTLSPDPRGLAELFTFWSPVPPRTVHRNIFELQPGYLLVAGPGMHPRTIRWAPSYPVDDPNGRIEPVGQGLSTADAAEAVRSRLTDAVKLRLRADIPVGAYLSGGLDSTITTCLAAREVGSNLHTFSVAFANPAFDESRYHELVARALGTQHHVLRVDDAILAAAFSAAVHQAERPLLRTAPVPLMLLSRHVRELGFKVVLTGEGADETFAGYNIFKEAKVRRWWAREPGSTRRPRLLDRLYPYQGPARSRAGAYWRRFFGHDLEATSDPYYSHRPRWRNTAYLCSFFSADVQRTLLDREPVDALADYLEDLPPASAPLSRAQYLEFKLFFHGYLISVQGDRMLMANGVEGRFPFLDPDVMDLAGRLPEHRRLPGLREKALLKRAFAREVPPAVAARPKQPYRAPGAGGLLTAPAVAEAIDAALDPAAVARLGLFDPARVTALLAKCRERVQHDLPVAPREDMALVAVLSSQILYNEPAPRAAVPPPAWWEGAERDEPITTSISGGKSTWT